MRPARVDRAGGVAREAAAAAMAALPYAVPLLVVVLERAILSPAPAVGDHFQFWAAGHLVATGRSPYDHASWLEMAALGPVPGGVAVNTVVGTQLTREFWLYAPQTAFLLAPFGALPIAIGVPLLNLFVLISAGAALVIAARTIGLAGPRLALALTLGVVSMPFVITVRDGHPIGLILLGVALAYLGLRDRTAWPVALGAVLVSVKPQIALVYAAAVLVILVMRRDVRAVALATAAVALVTVPAHVVHPFPLAAVAGSAGERSSLDLSTTGALARDLGGGIALTVPFLIVSVFAAVVALRLSPPGARAPVGSAALLAMSLVFAPYVHTYDELLALPAAFGALLLARGSRGGIALAAPMTLAWLVVPWVLFLWWPLQGQGERAYQGGPIGALPILALFGLALAAWLGRKTSTGAAIRSARTP